MTVDSPATAPAMLVMVITSPRSLCALWPSCLPVMMTRRRSQPPVANAAVTQSVGEESLGLVAHTVCDSTASTRLASELPGAVEEALSVAVFMQSKPELLSAWIVSRFMAAALRTVSEAMAPLPGQAVLAPP